MPRTAAWLPCVAPETGEPLPFNPGWSLRAMVVYDKWLWDRIAAASACDRWSMTLSAYNGGLGWLRRDQALAAEYGLDPVTAILSAPVTLRGKPSLLNISEISSDVISTPSSLLDLQVLKLIVTGSLIIG